MGHIIVSALIASLSVLVSSLVSLSLNLSPFSSSSPIHPSLPILIISHFHFSPSPTLHQSLSLPHPHRHPSLPILIALPTGGRSQTGLPVGCIVRAGFIVTVYKTREQSRRGGGKRGNGRDLCFPFSVSSQQGSLLPTATTERS